MADQDIALDPLSEPVPLDRQLCFSLYGASMAMTRLYKPLLDRMGITYPQYLVLHALWEEDGRTIGAIAARLSLESSTVTPLVKRLAAAGLVDRTRGVADERQVSVTLSDAGRAMRRDSICLAEAVLTRTGMSVAELTALNRQVQALRGALVGGHAIGG